MKYLITISLCLLAIFSNISVAQAQISRPDSTFSPKIIAKYSVLSLLEFETTAQLGVEYLFKPKMGFQQQFGYIFNSPTQYNQWGLRSRSEMRFYYSDGAVIRPYIAPEVLYKFVRQYGTRTFLREEGAYQQTIDFRADRNVIGFMPKIGFTNDVLKSKFAIDLAIGIGVKAVYYNSNVPKDAFSTQSFITDAFFNSRLRNSGSEVMPNFYFGFLLGFGMDVKN